MDIHNFIKKFSDSLELSNSVKLNENTNFKELGEWDSFSFLVIMGMFDSEFGITLKPDEIININTLGELHQLVSSNSKNE
jgi:acyl carrier protein